MQRVLPIHSCGNACEQIDSWERKSDRAILVCKSDGPKNPNESNSLYRHQFLSIQINFNALYSLIFAFVAFIQFWMIILDFKICKPLCWPLQIYPSLLYPASDKARTEQSLQLLHTVNERFIKTRWRRSFGNHLNMSRSYLQVPCVYFTCVFHQFFFSLWMPCVLHLRWYVCVCVHTLRCLLAFERCLRSGFSYPFVRLLCGLFLVHLHFIPVSNKKKNQTNVCDWLAVQCIATVQLHIWKCRSILQSVQSESK